MFNRSGEVRTHAHQALFFTWPMGLTTLRLLLLPLFLWIVLVDSAGSGQTAESVRHFRWLAVAVFVVMALTDKFDGCLARRFHQVTRLGAVLDPLADKLLVACSIIVLSFPWIAPAGYEIPFLVVLGVYGKDLGVALGALIILACTGTLQITPRIFGKLSTVLQLILVVATLLAGELDRLSRPLTEYMMYALWWLVILTAAAAALDYIIQGSRQYAAYRRRGEMGLEVNELTEQAA